MKIGIMTFPNMTSYGAVLQMYGLYRALRQLGADARVVNYHNAYMKARRHTSAFRGRSAAAAAARLYATKLLHARQILGFRRFESRMVKDPVSPTSDTASLPEIAKDYDGIVCGSDQVWNPNITGWDMRFFLDFCGPETKRIAYAPSFGISSFPEGFAERITPELKRFDSLSVREEDAVKLLEPILGYRVPRVLDPTFLISAEEWEELEKSHHLAKGDYILYFPVRKSPSLLRFSRELAEKRGARLIVVEGNLLTRLRNRDPKRSYALDVSPEEWLYLVHHAQCVVTNSFHGAAFAIHYRKDFYLELSSGTNSRLEQLLKITGLESRMVPSGCAQEETAIDYDRVEALLEPERKASLDYLRQAVAQ